MPREASKSLRLRPGHRLLLIFAATILAPGVLLGFFGLRALIQERRLADQQIRERVQVYSETVTHRLELELSEWQRAADQIIQAGPTNAALWPLRVRQAVAAPGSAVVLLRDRGRIQALPSGQLLFLPSAAREAVALRQQPLPLLAEAEWLELRDKNYKQAIARYRQLLAAAKPGQGAWALHRLARSLKKAGRIEEAIATFGLLEKEPRVLIGSLPSDLLALYEIVLLEDQPGNPRKRTSTALRLYHNLVNGAWQLQKPSYLFYSERVREMLPRSDETTRLEQAERQKLALSHAAERFLEEPRSFLATQETYCLSFWRSEPFVAIVLAESYLRSDAWPSAFRPESQGFGYSLTAPGGRVLFGRAPENRKWLITHSLPRPELPLLVETWPRDPAALQEKLGLRQNLYLGMLGVVVTLLAFGGYLTARTVRTELAVAQMKSDFVSTVSHEFRSPLAGITQLAEMLRDGRVKSDERRQQDYYEMIVNESQRLRRLVENVLDFSRMEEGRKQYRFGPFEPGPWLRRVVGDFQAEIAPAGLSLVARIPEDLPTLEGDPEALATAVHNLLDNAVKYSCDSKNSKIVWLETSANGHDLTISVRDRGVGIREEDRARIFEKFYRGGELREQVKGAGLGLSLVQHIVAAHGGAVDFSSRQGEGSTFSIHLKTAK